MVWGSGYRRLPKWWEELIMEINRGKVDRWELRRKGEIRWEKGLI